MRTRGGASQDGQTCRRAECAGLFGKAERICGCRRHAKVGVEVALPQQRPKARQQEPVIDGLGNDITGAAGQRIGALRGRVVRQQGYDRRWYAIGTAPLGQCRDQCSDPHIRQRPAQQNQVGPRVARHGHRLAPGSGL